MAAAWAQQLEMEAQAAVPGVRGLKEKSPLPPPPSHHGQTQTNFRPAVAETTLQGKPSPCSPRLEQGSGALSLQEIWAERIWPSKSSSTAKRIPAVMALSILFLVEEPASGGAWATFRFNT